MRIAVIDGQGGGIGKHIVEQLRKKMPGLDILALGTNALATGAMLRAGTTEGASWSPRFVIKTLTCTVQL